MLVATFGMSHTKLPFENWVMLLCKDTLMQCHY